MIVELGKQRFRRRSQLGLYRLADRLRRVGRSAGLQLGQLLGPFRAQEIWPRAEDLSELDEGRAQLGERFAQAGRLGQVADVFTLSVQEQLLDPVRSNTAHPGRQAVLGQRRSDFVKSLCVANE